MATGTTAQQIIDVVTPAAGESVSEGTLLEWHVKVGDAIKANDTIVEISTDKVDLELPSPASGTVTEILIEEGETVTVGQVIARISLNGRAPVVDGDADEVEAPAPLGPPDESPADTAAKAPVDATTTATRPATPARADDGHGPTSPRVANGA